MSKPLSPATITADQSVVTIAIRKDWLTNRSPVDETAARLLQAVDANGDGDWGGSDYPKIAVDAYSTASILKAIAGAFRRDQVES